MYPVQVTRVPVYPYPGIKSRVKVTQGHRDKSRTVLPGHSHIILYHSRAVVPSSVFAGHSRDRWLGLYSYRLEIDYPQPPPFWPPPSSTRLNYCTLRLALSLTTANDCTITLTLSLTTTNDCTLTLTLSLTTIYEMLARFWTEEVPLST